VSEIKITLEVAQQQFIAAMTQATKNVEELAKSIDKLDKSQKDATKAADTHAKSLNHLHQQTSKLAAGAKILAEGWHASGQAAAASASAIGRSVAAWNFLYDIVKSTVSLTAQAFTGVVKNIDDFQRATIGTAAAMTNLADLSKVAGATWETAFHRNLKATQQTFIELEKLAAKYFASSADLQLAYNAFAQRGIILRRTELEQLAQLTDLILLLTQGQQSTIQVQEEIRSLVNGTIRPTAQLAQLIKSYGLDVKQVAAEIRATNSLNPLAGVLKGAQQATTEIQKTFSAAYNGFETIVRQISRLGFDQFYGQIVGALTRFTDYLTKNRENIVGIFAVIGNVFGRAIDKVEKLTESFISGAANRQTIDQWATFIAYGEAFIEYIFLTFKALLEVATKIPEAIRTVSDALQNIGMDPVIVDLKKLRKEVQAYHDDLTQTEQSGVGSNTFKDIQRQKLAQAHDQLRLIDKTLEAAGQMGEGPLDFAARSTKLFIDQVKKAVPGLQSAMGDFGKAMGTLLEPLEALAKYDPQIAKKIQSIKGAFITGSETARQFTKQEAETEFPIRQQFTPSPEDLQKTQHLMNEVTAATDRYLRSARTASAADVVTATDLELQGMRRTLALLEQGFIAVGDSIQGIRSTVEITAQFMRDNQEALAFGPEDAKSFDKGIENLGINLSETQNKITRSVIENLDAQLQAARAGLEKFKTTAQNAAKALHATEVTPFLNKQQAILTKAQETFDHNVQAAEAFVTIREEELRVAKEELEVAAKGKDEAKKAAAILKVVNAEKFLAAEKQRVNSTIEAETERQNYAQRQAALQEEIAIRNAGRIDNQKDIQIAEQERRLGAEELRILQAKNVEIGKLLTANRELALATENRLREERKKLPTTDLKSQRADIAFQKTQFEVEISNVQGRIGAISENLRELFNAGEPIPEQLLAQAQGEKAYLQSLKDRQTEIIAIMEYLKNFSVSNAAIKNGVERSVDIMATALTDSFEGKKTDLIKGFKGVFDGIFKDSLVNLKQSLTEGLQKAFKGIADKLAPGMQDTLGPAMLAGFALIASFLLSQLLGDQGGQGSASNPTVGIQSTEQVRGLIGGETQIPIGQVAESLQDALVPTNAWLARIYGAIASGGGISTAQVESIIERSVNEALQIQPA
jgi:hypothetical protein